jgi:3'-5' exonuclease
MKRIFLDIETLPPSEDVRANLVTIFKQRAERSTEPNNDFAVAKAVDAEFRQLALRGEYGRLLTIGIIVEREGAVVHKGTLGRDRATMRFHLDEARTLKAFWNLIKDFDLRKDLFIGFNILDFDLHFIWQRSIIKGVRPTVSIPFARYRAHPVYDVMWEFENWKRRISLDELSTILGLESSKSTDVNGSKVYELFRQGQHQQIADYCMRDVLLVRDMYYRMNFLPLASESNAAVQALPFNDAKAA